MAVQKIIVLLITLIGSFPLFAYDYLEINRTTGSPIGWDNTQPIRYYLDPGTLGRYTNDQAHMLLQEAMKLWENVPNAAVPKFEFAGYLPEDVNKDNYDKYVKLASCYTGDLDSCPTEAQKNLQTIIIFDDDNWILENVLCLITGCFAIAGPMTYEQNLLEPPKFIAQGMAVFGRPSTNTAGLIAIFTHELGHLLGLSHSSLNQQLFHSPLTELDHRFFLPTMMTSYNDPVSCDRSPGATLSPDDEAAISFLYPSETLSQETVTIKGTIKKSDDAPMRHVNAVARNISDPLCKAYSIPSGRFCTNDVSKYPFYVDVCIEPTGDYILSDLEPGDYTVEVEEIDTDQQMNIALEDLAGDAEYWNEGDQADEDPYAYTIISLAAGETRENVDIILNRSEVTEDRVKFIPLDVILANFPLPETTACTDTAIDYAGLIGYEEPGTAAPAAGGCSLIIRK